MKNLTIIALIIIGINYSFSQKNYIYKNDSIKCEYQKTEGRLEGKYVSYYNNNQKKAEGYFKNNYRNGVWTVWDSLGNILIQRDYKTPFFFLQLIPKAGIVSPVKHEVKVNTDNYIQYYKLVEKAIVYTKSSYRYISKENNSILFDNNNLFNVIKPNIKNGNVKVYNDLDYNEEINVADLDLTAKVSNYLIKEIFVFDSDRLVSETRIIAIRPITENPKNDYWVYFPSIRKYLAAKNITDKNISDNIKTLDDLFFFRHFSGNILSETNVYNSNISAKTIRIIEKELAEDIELKNIEFEHYIWTGDLKK